MNVVVLKMKELYDDLCHSRLNEVIQNGFCARIFMLYNTYFEKLRKNAAFSMSYIDMWSDQGIERGQLATASERHSLYDPKDKQIPGGTEGFSLKPATLTKYYVNAEYRSICLRQLTGIIDQQSSRLSHHDLQPTRIKKDESDVQIVIDLLENSWENPFSETPGDLGRLATGRVAPNDVTRDLLDVHQIGNAT